MFSKPDPEYFKKNIKDQLNTDESIFSLLDQVPENALVVGHWTVAHDVAYADFLDIPSHIYTTDRIEVQNMVKGYYLDQVKAFSYTPSSPAMSYKFWAKAVDYTQNYSESLSLLPVYVFKLDFTDFLYYISYIQYGYCILYTDTNKTDFRIWCNRKNIFSSSDRYVYLCLDEKPDKDELNGGMDDLFPLLK